MTSLPQAVRAVRDEVAAGESLDDAIAFVAEESGLRAELLRRKVAESYGADPARVANSARSNDAPPPPAAKPARRRRASGGGDDFDDALIDLIAALGPDPVLAGLVRDLAPRLGAATLYPTIYMACKGFDGRLTPSAFAALVRTLPADRLAEVETRLAAYPEEDRHRLIAGLLAADRR